MRRLRPQSEKRRCRTIELICKVCSNKFTTDSPHKHAKTCSYECWETAARAKSGLPPRRRNTGKVKNICEVCGKDFLITPSLNYQKFCSVDCYNKVRADIPRSGRPPYEDDSRFSHRKYIMVKIGKKWEPEHRLVVEKSIGRKLTSKEDVHHINGDKTDNRLGNLQVVTRSEHRKIHCEASRIGLKVMAGELEVVPAWNVNVEGMGC